MKKAHFANFELRNEHHKLIPLPRLPKRRNRQQSLFLFSEKISRYNAKNNCENEPNRNKICITKIKVSINKNKVGITRNKVGITKNKVGITKNKVGITNNNGGITKKKVGITKNNGGITKNKVGIAKIKK